MSPTEAGAGGERVVLVKTGAYILGVDIGSVSIELAAVRPDKTVLTTAYVIHQGRVAEKLHQALGAFDLTQAAWVAATTSTPRIIKSHRWVDNRVALVTAGRRLQPGCGSILLVGGEKFGLIRFDADGHYANFKGNTACAAGTGSFLDQQAERLKLVDSAELSALAYDNDGMLPRIARAAPFLPRPTWSTPSRKAIPWRRSATACATGWPRISSTPSSAARGRWRRSFLRVGWRATRRLPGISQRCSTVP